MKKTVRAKFFLLFLAVMIGFILLGVLLNVLFLEKYYTYKNEYYLKQISTDITAILDQPESEIKKYIEAVDKLEGVSIRVINNQQKVIYTSFPKKENSDESKLPGELEILITDNQQKLKKNQVYTIINTQKEQAAKLVYISPTTEHGNIILTKPMSGIQESVSIANQFYMIIGLFMIFFGSVFMLYFSKKLTKPIEEISQVAEEISNLNFENKVVVKTNDEIGSLGESINIMSDKLSDSIDELRNDVKVQKELMRNISHELKTPIGIIKGYAEGLLYGVADNKAMMDKYCGVIVDECDRMDDMVTDFLDLSQLESVMIQLDRASFNLSPFILAILERFGPMFLDRNIICEKEITEDLMINADPQLLDRALQNMLSNAIKYNNEKGLIKVIAKNKADRIYIAIYNTGSQIPENEIQHIWDAFYKVDKSRTRNTGGHGLGLSIVKSIVLMHDGEITVENKQEGVLFTITLP